MLNKPYKATSKDLLSQKSAHTTSNKPSKHGLGIPVENITQITSYLDPPSLLALSRVNSTFFDYVQDDHTWHMAFARNFLSVDLQGDTTNASSIMLRRSEPSWKREYIVRFNIRRRWERSRSPTVIHIPLHSPIAQIHLLPNAALLASSLQYGIVSRSLPLRGKILRGYLSPSAAGTGLGIGNPNTEFAPNVSACSMFSEGGAAKIAWGLRNGEVAIMSAVKVSESGKRTAAKLTRCKVDEEHEGEVIDVAWDDSGAAIVSGARDGTVKLWDAKRARCLWTSDKQADGVVPDACEKVACDMRAGVVLAGLHNGDIVLWYGFKDVLSQEESSPPPALTIAQVKIPCPCPASPDDGILFHLPEISSIYVDATHPDIALLVTYKSQPQFYHVSVDVTTGSATPFTKFGNPAAPGCPITSVVPFFAANSDHAGFVIAGDLLGCICIYPWPGDVTMTVDPIKSFEAHEDGTAVTALAWNGVTLITGSSKGTTRVFDALSFECLRTFTCPTPRPRGGVATEDLQTVKQILVNPEKDMLVAAIGDRVMSWKAGLVPKSKLMKPKQSPGKAKSLAKGYEQLDLNQRISESLSLIDKEAGGWKRVHRREREQLENLERLGLDEVEAVEYVLMLSRDEAEHRERNAMVGEVFEGDFDDIPTTVPNSSQPSSVASSAAFSSSPTTNSLPARIIPRPSPSRSNDKVQVSPPYREEPKEAGRWSDSSASPRSEHMPDLYFPPISTDNSPETQIGAFGGKEKQPAWPKISPTPSPTSSKSAWSKPLNLKPTPLAPQASGSSIAPSMSSSSSRGVTQGELDEDEDLRLAIELSLAEAQSMRN